MKLVLELPIASCQAEINTSEKPLDSVLDVGKGEEGLSCPFPG